MKNNLVLLTAACALSLSAVPSYAGFEWRASAQGETQGFQVEAAPVEPVEMMAPIETIETTEDYSADPAPDEQPVSEPTNRQMRHAVVEDRTQAPTSAPAPTTAETTAQREDIRWNQPRAAATEGASQDDIGQIIQGLNDQTAYTPEERSSRAPGDPEGYYGFGRDIPMVMAMRQILPEGYNPAFARNIDMGARMTWNGDGNWQNTLRRALNDLGLDFYVEGRNVYISKDESASAPKTAAQSNADVLPAQSWNPPPAYNAPEMGAADSDMMPQTISEPLNRQRTSAPPVEFGRQAIGSADSVSEPMRDAEDRAESLTAREAPVNLAAMDRSMPSPRSAPDSQTDSAWTAGTEDTLRDTLEKWAAQDGTTLRWSTDYDYQLKRSVDFSGDFTSAVQNLLDQFAAVEPRPYGQLYKGDAERPVLVVKAYGDE